MCKLSLKLIVFALTLFVGIIQARCETPRFTRVVSSSGKKVEYEVQENDESLRISKVISIDDWQMGNKVNCARLCRCIVELGGEFILESAYYNGGFVFIQLACSRQKITNIVIGTPRPRISKLLLAYIDHHIIEIFTLMLKQYNGQILKIVSHDGFGSPLYTIGSFDINRHFENELKKDPSLSFHDVLKNFIRTYEHCY